MKRVNPEQTIGASDESKLPTSIWAFAEALYAGNRENSFQARDRTKNRRKRFQGKLVTATSEIISEHTIMYYLYELTENYFISNYITYDKSYQLFPN